jgi:hypothetical protein
VSRLPPLAFGLELGSTLDEAVSELGRIFHYIGKFQKGAVE